MHINFAIYFVFILLPCRLHFNTLFLFHHVRYSRCMCVCVFLLLPKSWPKLCSVINWAKNRYIETFHAKLRFHCNSELRASTKRMRLLSPFYILQHMQKFHRWERQKCVVLFFLGNKQILLVTLKLFTNGLLWNIQNNLFSEHSSFEWFAVIVKCHFSFSPRDVATVIGGKWKIETRRQNTNCVHVFCVPLWLYLSYISIRNLFIISNRWALNFILIFLSFHPYFVSSGRYFVSVWAAPKHFFF